VDVLEQMKGMNGPRKNLRPRQVLSTDVYEWPEFKALAERLGINLGVSTTVLTIQLAGDRLVVVDHQYEASDTLKDTVQPPMKQYNDKKWGQVLRCERCDLQGNQCTLDAGHEDVPGDNRQEHVFQTASEERQNLIDHLYDKAKEPTT